MTLMMLTALNETTDRVLDVTSSTSRRARSPAARINPRSPETRTYDGVLPLRPVPALAVRLPLQLRPMRRPRRLPDMRIPGRCPLPHPRPSRRPICPHRTPPSTEEPVTRICATCPQLEPCRESITGIRGGLHPHQRLVALRPKTANCGTNAGYHRHVKLREPTCEDCRRAHRAYRKARRKAA